MRLDAREGVRLARFDQVLEVLEVAAAETEDNSSRREVGERGGSRISLSSRRIGGLPLEPSS